MRKIINVIKKNITSGQTDQFVLMLQPRNEVRDISNPNNLEYTHSK